MAGTSSHSSWDGVSHNRPRSRNKPGVSPLHLRHSQNGASSHNHQDGVSPNSLNRRDGVSSRNRHQDGASPNSRRKVGGSQLHRRRSRKDGASRLNRASQAGINSLRNRDGLRPIAVMT